LICLSLLSG